MNHFFGRGRSYTHHRAVLGSLCASLLAMACAGGSEDGPSDTAEDGNGPGEPPLVDEVVVVPPRTIEEGAAPVPAAPETEEPAAAAAVGAGEEAPPVDEPEPARVCDGLISFDDLYANIETDLRAEGDDGVFLRYVSLSNRVNQGICPEDLAGDRLALIKALNSLSTEVSLAQPEAIDADGTLYRIDLRDYGWDQPTVVDGVAFNDKWEAIIAAAPSAIELEGDAADEAKLAANTTVPVLFGDALIDAATVGNVYYSLIGIGESEDELLAQLGIDEEDVVLRAGTTRSLLSRQDTLTERFDVANFQGYYWSRYDIADDTVGQSIFVNPLDFAADSIAAVFSLPNGMQGYALFDGAGVRVTDTDVVQDQIQRDTRVRNSVSCSQCHAAGLNAITDEVRQHVEANPFDFDADTFEDVQDEFLLQPEIDDIIQQDNESYLAALSRAGLDAAVGDPVSAAYVRFDSGVSLSVAAGELGVTPDVLRRELGLLSSQADPTLATLRTQSLQREQFEAAYLSALCVLSSVSENRPLAAACAAVGQ